jgi:SAM-dependent methyltransferase
MLPRTTSVPADDCARLTAFLDGVCARPSPFERRTARELWTHEHTSRKMLESHLNASGDGASRSAEFIARSAAWIAERFNAGPGFRIADFGCGPGLYTTPLARKGCHVTGIDFSERSLDHARKTASAEGLSIVYENQDYLGFDTAERFDLILLITCDYCALSRDDRTTLLRKFAALLADGGHVLFDVYSLNALAQRSEATIFAPDLLDGFWTAKRSFGFRSSFVYATERLALDKYTIVEPGRVREIFNWFQHFTPESLAEELAGARLTVANLYGDVAGAAFDPAGTEFAVAARCA